MLQLRRSLINNSFLKRNIVTNFKTLVEMQEKSCHKHKDRPLFGTKNGDEIKWTSYQEWNDDITTFRTFLYNIYVKPNDKIAIISNNNIEWSVSAYSTYSLGAVFVPMYNTQRKSDWKFILKDSESRVLICTDMEIFKNCKSFLNEIPTLHFVVYLDNNYSDLLEQMKYNGMSIRSKFEYNVKSIYPKEDDLASIIYTSGTTGNPKGVKITHKNLISNIKGIQSSFKDFSKVCNENDKSISFLPWAHCYGQTCELHGIISTGASMYLSEGVNKLVDELQIVKPTLLFSVPTLFNKIYDTINKNVGENKLKKFIFNDALETASKLNKENESKNLSKFDKIKLKIYDKILFSKIRNKLGGNLRHSFVGGAATPIEVIKFFEHINIPIIEGYGLTETSPIITLGSLDYPDRKIGCVGKPLPGNEVIIVENNMILENGKKGEILAFGDNIMQGYHKLDNTGVFEQINGKKYFRTGDLGYLDDDNRLYITGRIKEQYKLENGKYVIPTVLEGKYVLSPHIKQILLFGENQSYNIALIVPESNSEVITQFYIDEINNISKKNNIKNYEIPKKVILVDEFTVANGLLTPKLSIKRSKVVEKYKVSIDNLYKE